MTWLLDLIYKYNNPPQRFGTDKMTTHSYGEMYHELLIPRQATTRCVLEMGVFGGAFTEILSEVFPRAEIYGVDTNLEKVIFGKSNPYRKVYFRNIDVTDPASPALLNRKFDVIVDDASNLADDQVKAFDIWSKHLQRGGVYVIEDIDGAILDKILPKLRTIADREKLTMSVRDFRPIKHRYDDIAVVFTRP